MFSGSCSHVPMWPGLFVPKVICSQATRFSRSCSYIPLFTGFYDSNDLCFQATMFSGSCFQVPIFPGFFSGSCFISSYVPRPYVLKIMFFKKNLNSYSLSLQGHMLPQTYFTFPWSCILRVPCSQNHIFLFRFFCCNTLGVLEHGTWEHMDATLCW